MSYTPYPNTPMIPGQHMYKDVKYTTRVARFINPFYNDCEVAVFEDPQEVNECSHTMVMVKGPYKGAWIRFIHPMSNTISCEKNITHYLKVWPQRFSKTDRGLSQFLGSLLDPK